MPDEGDQNVHCFLGGRKSGRLVRPVGTRLQLLVADLILSCQVDPSPVPPFTDEVRHVPQPGQIGTAGGQTHQLADLVAVQTPRRSLNKTDGRLFQVAVSGKKDVLEAPQSVQIKLRHARQRVEHSVSVNAGVGLPIAQTSSGGDGRTAQGIDELNQGEDFEKVELVWRFVHRYRLVIKCASIQL